MSSITNPRMAERAERCAALSALSKANVLITYRNGVGATVIYSACPPEQETKDDLIADILDYEYGPAYMCGEANPITGRLCRVGRGVIHDTHAYDIDPADVDTGKI